MKFTESTLRTKSFESVEAIEAYIAHDDHGVTEDHPGVCFGVQVHEHAQNKYELELMFNDALVLDYKAIPNQEDQAADET
jgi:hypothetical protein